MIDPIMEIANHYEIPFIEDVTWGFCSKSNYYDLGTFG